MATTPTELALYDATAGAYRVRTGSCEGR